MAKPKVTFADVTTPILSTYANCEFIRRPAALKILLGGKVELRRKERYTDDYVADHAEDHGRTGYGEDIAELVERIKGNPKGWEFSVDTAEDGTRTLTCACHTFLTYEARIIAA